MADLGSFCFAPDSVEGITFGPTLADGSRSLVLIVDNNFSDLQAEQVIALQTADVPKQASLAILGAGFAGLVLMRRRRA